MSALRRRMVLSDGWLGVLVLFRERAVGVRTQQSAQTVSAGSDANER
jgi:hypothetical protein